MYWHSLVQLTVTMHYYSDSTKMWFRKCPMSQISIQPRQKYPSTEGKGVHQNSHSGEHDP